jgi:predicted ATPase with chaperone activity
MLDRIDLQIEVPAVSAADLVLPQASEGSAEVRTRVTLARRAQAERYAALGPASAPMRKRTALCSRRSPRPTEPA